MMLRSSATLEDTQNLIAQWISETGTSKLHYNIRLLVRIHMYIHMNIKYTKELLMNVVKECYSIAEVMRKLNIKKTGGSHSHLSRRLKSLDINISHFYHSSKSSWNLGKTYNKNNANDVLVLRTSGRRQEAVILRRCLIEIERLYKCEICNLEGNWNGKELRLQIDHINKNWLDDRKENLRFLCPNCHTQTDGYCGSKGLTGLVNKKSVINKTVETHNWRKHDRIDKRKVVRPPKETLQLEIQSNSFLALSKKYGVSDNTIRKWCKRYGLNHCKKTINNGSVV